MRLYDRIPFRNIATEKRPTTRNYIVEIAKSVWNRTKEVLSLVTNPYLAIYQAISPLSVDTTVKDHAKEYIITPEDGNYTRGIFFVHGFASSPQIFRKWAEMFAEEGYISYACRLHGHGTSLEHFSRTNIVQWYISARDAFIEFSKKCDEVVILAHSLGGLLSLILASIYPIHSMILLACPIKVRNRPLYVANKALRPISNIVKFWSVEKDRLRSYEEMGFKVYRKSPLRAVAGLFDGGIVAREVMKDVRCPVLAMIGDNDEHIEVNTLDYFRENIGSEIFETWIAPDSSHALIDTSDLDTFTSLIREFVFTNSPPH